MRTWIWVGWVALSGAAAAHEPVADPSWCADGTIQVLQQVEISADEVAGYADCLEAGECVDYVATQFRGPSGDPPCTIVRCGDAHSDWGRAMRLAGLRCAAYGPESDPRWPAPVVPFVVEPTDFYDSGHHESFVAGESRLVVDCARCNAPPKVH